MKALVLPVALLSLVGVATAAPAVFDETIRAGIYEPFRPWPTPPMGPGTAVHGFMDEYVVATDGFARVVATLSWTGDASLALTVGFDGSVQTDCAGFEGSLVDGERTLRIERFVPFDSSVNVRVYPALVLEETPYRLEITADGAPSGEIRWDDLAQVDDPVAMTCKV